MKGDAVSCTYQLLAADYLIVIQNYSLLYVFPFFLVFSYNGRLCGLISHDLGRRAGDIAVTCVYWHTKLPIVSEG